MNPRLIAKQGTTTAMDGRHAEHADDDRRVMERQAKTIGRKRSIEIKKDDEVKEEGTDYQSRE
jgi:hypothetical protein